MRSSLASGNCTTVRSSNAQCDAWHLPPQSQSATIGEHFPNKVPGEYRISRIEISLLFMLWPVLTTRLSKLDSNWNLTLFRLIIYLFIFHCCFGSSFALCAAMYLVRLALLIWSLPGSIFQFGAFRVCVCQSYCPCIANTTQSHKKPRGR